MRISDWSSDVCSSDLGAHDLERCRIVTEAVLVSVFYELHRQRVAAEGMLLKPNMEIGGTENSRKASAEQVAAATVRRSEARTVGTERVRMHNARLGLYSSNTNSNKRKQACSTH